MHNWPTRGNRVIARRLIALREIITIIGEFGQDFRFARHLRRSPKPEAAVRCDRTTRWLETLIIEITLISVPATTTPVRMFLNLRVRSLRLKLCAFTRSLLVQPGTCARTSLSLPLSLFTSPRLFVLLVRSFYAMR